MISQIRDEGVNVNVFILHMYVPNMYTEVVLHIQIGQLHIVPALLTDYS